MANNLYQAQVSNLQALLQAMACVPYHQHSSLLDFKGVLLPLESRD
jgi:hypothetical protein